MKKQQIKTRVNVCYTTVRNRMNEIEFTSTKTQIQENQVQVGQKKKQQQQKTIMVCVDSWRIVIFTDNQKSALAKVMMLALFLVPFKLNI